MQRNCIIFEDTIASLLMSPNFIFKVRWFVFKLYMYIQSSAVMIAFSVFDRNDMKFADIDTDTSGHL